MPRASDWITKQREAVGRFLDAAADLRALRTEWNALDYGNTLTPEDFAGANEAVTLEEMGNAMASLSTLDEVFAVGHATNLYRVRS